jgi:hypothetical protein
MNGWHYGYPFLLLASQKHLPIHQKYAVPQKIDITGSRLPGVCGGGKVFVPSKFDALKTTPMRLNGQNPFRALFSRAY